MLFIKFLTIYMFSGYLLKTLFDCFFSKKFPGLIKTLTAYGVAPLIISLLLYLLYYLFPYQTNIFYELLIYFPFLAIIFFFRAKISSDLAQLNSTFKKYFHFLTESFVSLRLVYKICALFVLFILLFVILRVIAYPPTWTDAISYLRQGQVFGFDRSLERAQTRTLFPSVGGDFIIDTAIRPALPILFSYFYGSSNSLIVLPTSFLYVYYFLLTVIIFSFMIFDLTKSKERVVLGLTLLFSSFYFIHYNLINFKEIILIFLTLLIFHFVSYLKDLKQEKDRIKLFVIIGILFGLSIYVNFSGSIISFLIGLSILFFWKYPIKRKIALLILTIFVALFFSGGELIYNLKFFFKPSLLSIENQTETFQSSEISAYGIVDPNLSTSNSGLKKKNILVMGKLQGLSQPYLFSVVFYLFVALLVINLKNKNKRNSLLIQYYIFFIFGWFFLIMDPFFLNPHQSAYVLSINPKYTVMLLPFIVIVCTYYWDHIDQIFKKLKFKYLYTISIFVLLSIKPVRDLLSNKLFELISKSLPIANERHYYISKLNSAFIVLSLIALLFLLLILIIQKRSNNKTLKIESLTLFFVTLLFIFPFTFEFISNYKVPQTFKHALNPVATEKLAKVSPTKLDQDLFDIIGILNGLNNHDVLNVLLQDGYGSYYSNLAIVIKNNRINQRAVNEKDKLHEPETGLLLIQNSMLKENNSSINESQIIHQNEGFTLVKLNQ